MCSSFPGRLGEGGPAHREIAVPWRVGAEAESSAEERGRAPREAAFGRGQRTRLTRARRCRGLF